MSVTTRRRRRLSARVGAGADCHLTPPVRDAFVSQLLCQEGISFETPYCAGVSVGSAPMFRSAGMDAATGGFSAGIALVLLALFVMVAVWCRRRALLRRVQTADEGDFDPEHPPPKSAILTRRRQRRLRRLLHLHQQHVHFSDAVDVNEIGARSATTLTSSSAGPPTTVPAPRGRHGSAWVSPADVASIIGSDATDEAASSGPASSEAEEAP
ncbi:uncharacterized protein LOC119101344 [Pollicipes pollicipes]|uniref:uncharacterized protein LOC119101344 n=1 Tax=Pollicipes pollicipes TaxID=41117 RepID=UPI0018852870|nr:uncharacterized protein LOC119101344 [Pollicipes pollicipes]